MNTGPNNGCIRYLELMLERNLQHGICLLHFDEIIFGHLFVFYCGPSTGPGVFKTELGQQVTCISQNLKPITNYKQVKSIFDWSSFLQDTKLKQMSRVQTKTMTLIVSIVLAM